MGLPIDCLNTRRDEIRIRQEAPANHASRVDEQAPAFTCICQMSEADRLASLALDRNRSQDAATLAERAVEILRTTGAPRDIVHATTLLITARGMHQARFAEAFALVEDCLDTASGDELLRLRCINSRASLAYNLADYETAVGDYAEVAAPSSLLPEKLKATARMNLAPLVIDEITVVGSRCGPFPPALRALETGTVEVLPLISDCYPLSRGIEGLEAARTSGALKILLVPTA